MAKKKTVTNKKSIAFLEQYLNNASPTGFESEGQKLWLDYIKTTTKTGKHAVALLLVLLIQKPSIK